MKFCYNSIATPGSHSKSHAANHSDDVLVIDQLAVQLYIECNDWCVRGFAVECSAGKENIKNASQSLAPGTQPLPDLLQENCQPSLTRNSLS